MGTENFGIVGLYISIQAFFGLMDFGLPITANRQVSILRANTGSHIEVARLIRAFEIIILIIALFGLLIMAVISPWLSANWLNPVSLSIGEITIALIMAGASAALRFPCAFYNNILFAFDRHFAPNFVTAMAAYLRVLIAVIFLIQFGPSLESFFLSQLIVNGVELIALQYLAWRKTVGVFFVSPDWQQFKKTIRLTLSLSLVSLTAFALSQIDKVILVKLLPLDQFGAYSVAFALAMGLLPLSYSIGNAVFPEFSRLKAKAITHELSEKLSKALRLTLLLVVPAAAFLITQNNGYEGLLGLFTNEAKTISLLLPVLAMGSLFQAFVVLPHAYRIAAGEVRYILWINSALITPYMIAVYFGTLHGGIIGACWAFMGLNFLNFIFHYYYLRANPLWVKNYVVLLLSMLTAIIIGFILANLSIFADNLWTRLGIALINILVILAGMYYFLLYGTKRT